MLELVIMLVLMLMMLHGYCCGGGGGGVAPPPTIAGFGRFAAAAAFIFQIKNSISVVISRSAIV